MNFIEGSFVFAGSLLIGFMLGGSVGDGCARRDMTEKERAERPCVYHCAQSQRGVRECHANERWAVCGSADRMGVVRWSE